MIGINKYTCHVSTGEKTKQDTEHRKQTSTAITLHGDSIQENTNVLSSFSVSFLSQRVLLCQPKMTSKSWWSRFCSPRSGKMECVSTPRDKTSLYQVFAWLVASNKARTLWEGTRITRSPKWSENSSVAARIMDSTQSLDTWPTYTCPTMNCFTVHPWS